MSSREITNLNYDEARDFFFENKSYVNFDTPYYIDFEELLTYISVIFANRDISSMCIKKGKKIDLPSNYEDINHIILSNKDGAYSWRPMHIIHPVLYVNLVKIITEKKNWEIIQSRFKQFSKSYVHCISIPRESEDFHSDKASLVKFWWERIEQESIKKSLDYNYLFKTDISDCYGSIYTHSIEWALDKEGREAVKNRIIRERLNKVSHKKTLGGEIDIAIRSMSYNQTNGIPQGSTLMDFIAEIVLGYADLELTTLIKKLIRNRKLAKKDFYILRYRDDYRIFVNDPNMGQEIMKLLSSVLYGLGMKLNPGKTMESNDVILSSIKLEKLEIILTSPAKQMSLQKEALRIYQISKKYPNSGLVSKELSLFFDRLEDPQEYKDKENLEVLISILTMIAFFSPRVINWVSAIISKILECIEGAREKKYLVKKIHNRFSKIPKTGLIDIWLQRISAPLNISINYSNKLTKVALGEVNNSKLWNCSWLSKEAIKVIDFVAISTLPKEIKEKSISPVIQRKEVELFNVNYF